MPTLCQIEGDVVSVLADGAGAAETVAIEHLRRGKLDRAVLALRAAQRALAKAELEVLERIRTRDLEKATRGRSAARRSLRSSSGRSWRSASLTDAGKAVGTEA